jgi:hypothetical protein
LGLDARTASARRCHEALHQRTRRKAVAELYHDLIEQFEYIDLLQFSAGKCVVRLLVAEDSVLTAFGVTEQVRALLKDRGIDDVVARVVDIERDTSLPDQLRQAAYAYGGTAFTDAVDEIEKSRAIVKRLRRQLREATRYKAAAEALWKLLDNIDTADDAARENDARYRATARTMAKRRYEHAQSFDGHTLVWSWESPLPAADMAKLEVKVLQGETTDDEIAEYKRLVALHEPSPERGTAIKLEVDAQIQEASLPPEFYDGTSAAAEKDLTSEEVAGALEHKGVLKPELLELAAKDLHKRSYGPAPTFLERIAEAAKTATADDPATVEVQSEKYSAADCIRVPSKIAKTRAAAAIIAGQPIEPLPPTDPAVITVSQFAEFVGVSPEQVTVEDGKFSVAIPAEGGTLYTCPEQKPTPADVADALEAVDPANPDFAPALDLLADAELPIADDCPGCHGTGEDCSSGADDG